MGLRSVNYSFILGNGLLRPSKNRITCYYVFPAVATVARPDKSMWRGASEGSEYTTATSGGKRWKITFLFARRYLGDRKSYREERKRVLKGKVPRFQSSFARQLEIVVFQVTAVQSFRNFNTVWSEAKCPTVTAFLSRSIYNICTGCANIAGVELNVERDRFLVEPHTWLDYCRKVNNWTEKVSLFLTYIFWREAAWTPLKIQSRRNSQRRNF